MPLSDNEHNDNTSMETQYFYKEELIDILRRNMSNDSMHSEISEDMRVISVLNARAATAGPALSALYMTIAAELADSVKFRMETEINARLVKALGTVGSPDIDGNVVSNIKKDQGKSYLKSSNIRYAFEVEDGQITKGLEVIDEIRDELQSKLNSDIASRLSEEKEFARSAEKKIKKDRQRYEESDSIGDDLRDNFNDYDNSSFALTSKFDESLTNDKFIDILTDRFDNIRAISRSIVNDNKILDPSRVIDHEQSEYSIDTLVYLMDKTANAIEAATKGKSVDSSLSRLDRSKLSLLGSIIKESGPNFAFDKDEYYNIYGKVCNYASLSDLTGKRIRSNESSLAVENGKLGMCIANDGTAEIHASEFIDKINSGKPLTEAEKNWACSQFDIMAKLTGADIHGMYVNGEPVFHPDFYGKEGYEDKAKCELIASAMEGKRIAAVPVKGGIPESDKKPVPVRVVDITEPTLSLWEKILEFFGLGRGNSIRKANDLKSSARVSDAEKIADDLKQNASLRAQSEYLRGRNFDFGSENNSAEPNVSEQNVAEQNPMPESHRLKAMMESALEKSEETMKKNEREFFSSYYEKAEKETQIDSLQGNISLKVGAMVNDDLMYTGENGKSPVLIATLHRMASHTHMIYLYGMTEKGYSLEEMLHGENVDRKAIGDEFMEKFSMKKLNEFAKEKNLDADSPEARKSYNEYVLDKKQELMSLSNRMFETLKKQEYIAADPNDPESCIKNYELTSNYFGMICDFVQAFSPMRDNELNPSDPSANNEVDRTSAINNYQYYSLMPLQTYYTAYSKYMDFLSSDYMLAKDEDSTLMDMAAHGKCFLENVQQWTKGKKTWGDIANDRQLANNINSTGAMCCVEDVNFQFNPMNDINFAYLHSTDKNFNYMTIDPSRAAFKRLGFETSNEEICRDNQQDYERAESEAAKYLPWGFTENLDKAYTNMIAREKESKKVPMREKMDFDELVGNSTKHIVKSVAPSEKQLEKEKSMNTINAK